MKLIDFIEKIDVQAKQLEMIGFKGDVLFTSMKQFVDKMIFKLVPDEMDEEQVKLVNSLRDSAYLKKVLDTYREIKNSGVLNSDNANSILDEELKKRLV